MTYKTCSFIKEQTEWPIYDFGLMNELKQNEAVLKPVTSYIRDHQSTSILF